MILDLGGVYMYPNCKSANHSQWTGHDDCNQQGVNRFTNELNVLESYFIPYGIFHESKSPSDSIGLSMIFFWKWPDDIRGGPNNTKLHMSQRRKTIEGITNMIRDTCKKHLQIFKLPSEEFAQARNPSSST